MIEGERGPWSCFERLVLLSFLLSCQHLELEEALQRNVGGFSEGQRSYLAFPRASVLLQSRLRR